MKAPRWLTSLLVLAVWLGAPLHCLAEALETTAGVAARPKSDGPSAPAVHAAPHCCHPEGLLPAVPAFSAARISERLAFPALLPRVAPGAGVVRACDHGPPRERGRPLDGASSGRSLPLLI